MTQALRVFFLSGDYGPSMIVATIVGMTQWRLQSNYSTSWSDVAVFFAAILLWSFQEYFLHDQVLHSDQDWWGKQIHQEHHDKPYYHVSIDPAPLLLGWMMVAHVVLFRCWLPLPLAVSATLGYSVAGLFYEWTHYIVHTKVRFRGWTSRFWIRVRDNHVRHHRICSDYWYAFSVPWMDDLFRSNPTVQDVQRRLRRESGCGQ
jgi:sterol desaturase/sphingolipid hydroxylase (fatty acid hydroxylase superfamily)